MFSFTPKFLDNFIIHNDIANYLSKFNETDTVNILFIGKSNSGKKTLSNAFIANMFKLKEIPKKTRHTYTLKISNSSVEIQYISTPFYYEVNLYEYGLYDINVITDFISTYVEEVSINKQLKYIILNHFDKISVNAQLALKKIIDNYSHTSRFILIADEIQKIDKTLLSRFNIVRIPEPTEIELKNYIKNVLAFYKLEQKKNDLINNFYKESNGNLFKLNCLLNAYIHTNKLISLEEPLSYYERLYSLIEKPNLETMLEIRTLLYEFVLLNIPLVYVIKDIITHYIISNLILDKYKHELIEYGSKIQHKMCQIEHDIIALEYFILKVKKLLVSK